MCRISLPALLEIRNAIRVKGQDSRYAVPRNRQHPCCASTPFVILENVGNFELHECTAARGALYETPCWNWGTK